MKVMPRTFAFPILLLAALLPAWAAGAAADMPALRVAAIGITETRNSSTPLTKASASISLNLRIFRDSLPPRTFLRQHAVTKAVDNRDRPLAPGAPLTFSLDLFGQQMLPTFLGYGPNAGAYHTSTILPAPARDAESLKLVEGAVEFFLPTESNGSIIRVANIRSHPGRIEDPILARHGVVFHFLGSKATADEAGALDPRGIGWPLNVEPNSVSAIGYYFSDPNGKLAGFQLEDSRGNQIQTNSPTAPGHIIPRPGNGYFVSRVLSAPLPADAQLVIYILVPEAIRSAPFRIENIPLP